MASKKAALAACSGGMLVNAMQQLESMGYRFTLDGDQVRYALYGGQPPPEAQTLLHSLDRDFVRGILKARQAGYTVVKPQIVRVPWEERYRYLLMIHAAQLAGELVDVKVTFIRKTKECVYELIPPGVDFMKYDVMKGETYGKTERIQAE